jgi:hypothetical protein
VKTFETVVEPKFWALEYSNAWSMIVYVDAAVGVPCSVGKEPL